MQILGSLQAFSGAYAQSDFFGKLIMGGLFLLSAICWIVLIWKVWQVKQIQKSSRHFLKFADRHRETLLRWERSEIPRASSKYAPEPLLKIYLVLREKTLEILNKKLFFSSEKTEAYLDKDDIDMLEQCVSTTISSEYKIVEKHLFILSTIVTLAPFLGLLGTVWGILVTFADLTKGAAAGSSTAILGGLSTALATTVLGLVIAIPALIGYNYLRNYLKVFSSDMEDFLYSLLSTLEMQYRKVQSP